MWLRIYFPNKFSKMLMLVGTQLWEPLLSVWFKACLCWFESPLALLDCVTLEIFHQFSVPQSLHHRVVVGNMWINAQGTLSAMVGRVRILKVLVSTVSCTQDPWWILSWAPQITEFMSPLKVVLKLRNLYRDLNPLPFSWDHTPDLRT